MTRNSKSSRRSAALTLTGAAIVGLLIGTPAQAAQAEMDPDNGPAQTLPLDNSDNGNGTPLSWVADRYKYIDSYFGYHYYLQSDGSPGVAADAPALASNLGYAYCYKPWWTWQLACSD